MKTPALAVLFASVSLTVALEPAIFANYGNAGEIAAMPACTASVTERLPCSLKLTAADGQVFYLGNPGSPKAVSDFLGTLKEGQAYAFPGVFLEYQKQNPVEKK